MGHCGRVGMFAPPQQRERGSAVSGWDKAPRVIARVFQQCILSLASMQMYLYVLEAVMVLFTVVFHVCIAGVKRVQELHSA